MRLYVLNSVLFSEDLLCAIAGDISVNKRQKFHAYIKVKFGGKQLINSYTVYNMKKNSMNEIRVRE